MNSLFVKTKNVCSVLRFCNLTSSIEITYMLAAIKPRRFCDHKIYYIVLQKVRNYNLLGAAVQIHEMM